MTTTEVLLQEGLQAIITKLFFVGILGFVDAVGIDKECFAVHIIATITIDGEESNDKNIVQVYIDQNELRRATISLASSSVITGLQGRDSS